MDRFIDMLDAWVDRGTAPPPSRSDAPNVAGKTSDGTHGALALPEVACPLGVYFPYPNSVAASTSFAAFTGKGLEPLDGSNVFVDMNRNGVWDERETPTQAWRRLGLIGSNEALTPERYVACVQQTTRALVADGFLSDGNAVRYVEQARQTDLLPKS